MGPFAARSGASRRGRRQHSQQIHRGLREDHRPRVRKLAFMKARVAIDVMFKEGILDPQGKTVEDNLPSLGFNGVTGVRVGKHIELEIEAASREEAEQQVAEMSRRL